MTQPNHEDAIATLLNQSLKPKGINVATLSKDNSLSILLSSTEPLEAQATAAFILTEIQQFLLL